MRKNQSFLLLALLLLSSSPLLGAENRQRSLKWWQEPWLPASTSERQVSKALKEMLDIIEQSKQGSILLKQLPQPASKVLKDIHLGDHSLTETTFFRIYAFHSTEEEFIVKNSIQVKRNLKRIDLFYDLVHELTHYTLRKPLNPYKINFSIEKFIQHGIEGVGGELDAFEMECTVGWEIKRVMPIPDHPLCGQFRFKDTYGKARFHKRLAQKKFYSVGKHYNTIDFLKEHLHNLSKEAPFFQSSLEGMPYPLALIKEFNTIRRTACANNELKVLFFKEQASKTKRSISTKKKEEYSDLIQYQRKHCI